MKIHFQKDRDQSDQLMRIYRLWITGFGRTALFGMSTPGLQPAADYIETGRWEKRGWRVWARAK